MLASYILLVGNYVPNYFIDGHLLSEHQWGYQSQSDFIDRKPFGSMPGQAHTSEEWYMSDRGYLCDFYRINYSILLKWYKY